MDDQLDEDDDTESAVETALDAPGQSRPLIKVVALVLDKAEKSSVRSHVRQYGRAQHPTPLDTWRLLT